LADIWTCIGGDSENIKQVSCDSDPGRCLKIIYILKNPVKLISISRHEEFTFEKKGGVRTDVFRARLTDFGILEYEMGDLVTVTFQKTFFQVSTSDMIAWLAPFGEVEGDFWYIQH